MNNKTLLKVTVIAVVALIGVYITYVHYTRQHQNLNQKELLSSNSNNSTVFTDSLTLPNTYSIEGAKLASAIISKTTYSEVPHDCIELSEFQIKLNDEIFREFLSDNSLSITEVSRHLADLPYDELELEIKAGNNEAAFVLGMNLFHFSYNLQTKHPLLS